MARVDLQPWLDYFRMVREYENKGFIETQPEKNAAFITQPALHALSEGDDPQRQLPSIADTARRLRSYVVWKRQEGAEAFRKPFALHVVKADEPHDMLYTLLLLRRRPWWRLWRMTDCIEVIDYAKEKTT